MRLLIFFLILFSTNAFADYCPLFVRVGSVDFSQVTVDQSIAVDVDIYRFTTSNQCKQFDLGVSSGSANSYSRKLYNGTSTLNYNIYNDDSTSTALRSVNDAQNNNQRVRFKMDNFFKKITLYVRLPYWGNSTSLENGLYTDTTQVQVYPRGNNTGGSSSNLITNLNVQSDVNISLVGRGGQYDENQTSYSLDFGTMTAGKMRSFDLIVKSNTGYRINVSSEYDGSLAHNENSSYKVGYNFSVNGSNMSLVGSKSSPKQIYASSSASQNGEVIEVDISLLSTSNKLSGTYTDYIYFTAISN